MNPNVPICEQFQLSLCAIGVKPYPVDTPHWVSLTNAYRVTFLFAIRGGLDETNTGFIRLLQAKSTTGQDAKPLPFHRVHFDRWSPQSGFSPSGSMSKYVFDENYETPGESIYPLIGENVILLYAIDVLTEELDGNHGFTCARLSVDDDFFNVIYMVLAILHPKHGGDSIPSPFLSS